MSMLLFCVPMYGYMPLFTNHDGANVGEVHVDETGLNDDLADAHHALPQNVVRHEKGLA